MAGASVRQRQVLAGAGPLKRLLRLCGPFQAEPVVSGRSASPRSSRIPSFIEMHFSAAGAAKAAQLAVVWPWCVCCVGEVHWFWTGEVAKEQQQRQNWRRHSEKAALLPPSCRMIRLKWQFKRAASRSPAASDAELFLNVAFHYVNTQSLFACPATWNKRSSCGGDCLILACARGPVCFLHLEK